MADASPEARWSVGRSAAAGYIDFVVLASFGGWGATCSYDFVCPSEPRGGSCYVSGGALCRWGSRTLLVVAHSVGYRGRGENGRLVQNCEGV